MKIELFGKLDLGSLLLRLTILPEDRNGKRREDHHKLLLKQTTGRKRDAAAGQKYVPLSEEWIQKLFGIIAVGSTPRAAEKLRAAVPSAETF